MTKKTEDNVLYSCSCLCLNQGFIVNISSICHGVQQITFFTGSSNILRINKLVIFQLMRKF